MDRAAVSADIITALEVCLSDLCPDFVFFRSRGVPPADRESVAFTWIDRARLSFEDCDSPDCKPQFTSSHAFRIVVTTICMTPDAQRDFDYLAEDNAAARHDAIVDQAEECLACSPLFAPIYARHGVYSVVDSGTTYDPESQGGGFSSYINVVIEAQECCS